MAAGAIVLIPTVGFAQSNFAGFDPASNVSVGDGPAAVALGFLDGDSFLDLAVLNFQQGSISVRLGLGDGSFLSMPELFIGPNPDAIDLGDIDHDGDLDMVVAQNLNTGQNDRVIILFNNGHGGFDFAGLHSVDSSPQSIQLVDLDNDGNLDLLVGVFNGVTTLFGDDKGFFGDPKFIQAGSSFVIAKAADINMDGKADIVATSFIDQTVSVLINQGAGRFSTPIVSSAGGSPRALEISDVDRDGWNDLVLATSTPDSIGALFYLRGVDGMHFAEPIRLGGVNGEHTGVAPWDVVVADFDFNHFPDVASSNQGSGDVTIFLNDQMGGFEPPQFFPVGANARDLAVGDVNNDGSQDLVVASQGADAIAVLLNLTLDPIDLSGNGVIDGADLAILLSLWGTDGLSLGADLNSDGVVDGADLAILLTNWTS